MAATVDIVESNGAGETITAITNCNMGSSDTVNMTAADYPITAGTRSYAKYQRFRATTAGGSTKLKNFKVWRTGSLTSGDTHVTGAATADYAEIAYATPVNTAITDVDNAMPTASPATANVGYEGSLTEELTLTGSALYTDYIIHQLVIHANTVAGTTTTMSYSYDEIA
jgi:hypothetical protein